MGDITKNFNESEFKCKCCGQGSISTTLVDRLQEIRDVVGPIVIDSGFRCEKYNADPKVGGKPNSAHLRGLAADVTCPDSHFRYDFLSMAFSRFSRIEVGTNWIHVDVDPSLPQDVCFLSG